MLCQGPGDSVSIAGPVGPPSTPQLTYPMPAEDHSAVSVVPTRRHLTPTDSSTIETTVAGGSSGQRDAVAWALKRFADIGLDLPALHFDLHPDASACSGNRGFFSPSSTPWTIAVCTDELIVVLHEIGHAWAEHRLTEADRAAYVEARGLESWNDPETPWRARGSEDAANTLAWGLLDTPIRGMPSTGLLVERNRAFVLLTGIDSPRIVD